MNLVLTMFPTSSNLGHLFMFYGCKDKKCQTPHTHMCMGSSSPQSAHQHTYARFTVRDLNNAYLDLRACELADPYICVDTNNIPLTQTCCQMDQ
jgi:hypothetical protein